ncbi:hypothetical protein BRADI_4g24583v3 [Brachypodium distachyon]|uniref:Uncharacterized protein n=1 Tax=Brachypodium distachyon TaxID=15368 RepID=A0A0Q3PIT8_BRADI|nr:hypothetical protein BRADI_4g24583v3 [Brachypodium distachyon]
MPDPVAMTLDPAAVAVCPSTAGMFLSSLSLSRAGQQIVVAVETRPVLSSLFHAAAVDPRTSARCTGGVSPPWSGYGVSSLWIRD